MKNSWRSTTLLSRITFRLAVPLLDLVYVEISSLLIGQRVGKLSWLIAPPTPFNIYNNNNNNNDAIEGVEKSGGAGGTG